MQTSSTYTIEIWHPVPPGGVQNFARSELVADISPICTDRRFTVRRNRASVIELQIHLREAEDLARTLGMEFYHLFAAGRADIRIRRGDRYLVDGQIIYTDPGIEEDTETFHIRAAGFLDLFAQKYLWPTGTKLEFEDWEIQGIMETILDEAQTPGNSNIAFDFGPMVTTPERSEQYQPWATSSKDVLIGISEWRDSVDFELRYDEADNKRKIFTYYPYQGQDKSGLLFTYPGNIKSLRLPKDSTQIVNYAIARGQGNGLDVQVVETAQDQASIDYYGSRQRIDDYPSLSRSDTLQSRADEVVRTQSNPLTIPDVVLYGHMEPFIGAYWIGDWVRFSVPNRPAFLPLNGRKWRINEISVNISPEDHEEVRLKVGNS